MLVSARLTGVEGFVGVVVVLFDSEEFNAARRGVLVVAIVPTDSSWSTASSSWEVELPAEADPRVDRLLRIGDIKNNTGRRNG